MKNSVIEELKKRNALYAKSGTYGANVSGSRRDATSGAQSPFAAVVACSDSRVIPEVIFNAGIGELFVVRTAGNTVGEDELASIDYAVHHLGVSVVIVLGHTCCGAVAAALGGGPDGRTAGILGRIRRAAGGETDPYKVSRSNALRAAEDIRAAGLHGSPAVAAAIYDIRTGAVEFIENDD